MFALLGILRNFCFSAAGNAAHKNKSFLKQEKTSTVKTSLEDLPVEILLDILRVSNIASLGQIAQLSGYLNGIIRDNIVWKPWVGKFAPSDFSEKSALEIVKEEKKLKKDVFKRSWKEKIGKQLAGFFHLQHKISDPQRA